MLQVGDNLSWEIEDFLFGSWISLFYFFEGFFFVIALFIITFDILCFILLL